MTRWTAASLVALSLGLIPGAQADPARAPVKERGLVYRLELFNGRAHVYAYSPPKAQTIYALAGTALVLNPRMTLVYSWPITRRDMADWDGLDEPVTGALEVLRAGGVISTPEPTPYALTRRSQNVGEATLSVGPEASKEYATYRQTLNDYWAAIAEYQQRRIEYDRALAKYARQGGQGRRLPVPHAPTPVSPLDSYTTAPDLGFVVTLPGGDYRVRLRGPDGQILPGSERRLVVFTHRRAGVSYTIRPESRWTVSERSSAPEDTIYAKVNTTLFLQAFLAREYPTEAYRRLTDPQDLEMVRGWTWVDVQPLHQMALRLHTDSGAVTEVTAKPYFVRQTSGSSLGYDIVEYDAARMPGQSPSFTAFKLSVVGNSQIEMAGHPGPLGQSATRSIRMVTLSKSWVLYLPGLAVLLGGAWIMHRHRLGPLLSRDQRRRAGGMREG